MDIINLSQVMDEILSEVRANLDLIMLGLTIGLIIASLLCYFYPNKIPLRTPTPPSSIESANNDEIE